MLQEGDRSWFATPTAPNPATLAAPRSLCGSRALPSSAAPTIPKTPAAMQQGGSSSFSDAANEDLEKRSASDLAARASTSSASVSSASTAASATRIENNFDLVRETRS